jgi:radical SAM protein with 4Fe4S-binding SPASM domain
MPVSSVEPFLRDNNPDVRKAAIRSIVRSKDPLADELITVAINDADPSVWKAARSALLYRQPWLMLEPFIARPVPEQILTRPAGKMWSHLRNGINRIICDQNQNITFEQLYRWGTIPGAMPDVIEALMAVSETEIAEKLTELTHLYGRQQTTRQQILLAPTYRCNLSCDYCYAKDWGLDFPDEMSLNNLEQAFAWMSDQGINYMILCGGEPTVYTHFPTLLSKARDRNIRIMLTTNGLYSKTVQEFINNNYIEEFIGHYDQETMLTRDTQRRQFIDNLLKARNNGVNVILRYTLTENSTADEWTDLIDMAKTLDVNVISYGFAFKNVAGNNNYYDYQLGKQRKNFEQVFTAFFNDCSQQSLKLHQSKPFPLCLLEKDTLRKVIFKGSIRLSCTAHARHFSHNVTINPDLSTFPCNGLGIRGPKITTFESLVAVGRYYAEQLQQLQYHPYDTSCQECLLFYRGFCQGVCLAQHYNQMINSTE